jgi:hypothetical protein
MECGSTYKMHYVGPAEDPHSHDHGHDHHGASNIHFSTNSMHGVLTVSREPLPQAKEHGRLPQARVHAHLNSRYPESIELVLYLYGPCSIVGWEGCFRPRHESLLCLDVLPTLLYCSPLNLVYTALWV